MSKVQVIEQDGKPAFYVVPADIWLRVRDRVEDAEDVAAYDEAVANDDGVRVPMAVVKATGDGAHVVRAWREYRQMTQEQLAKASGISKPFLSQIEGSVRAPSLAFLRRIAAALGVSVGALAD